MATANLSVIQFSTEGFDDIKDIKEKAFGLIKNAVDKNSDFIVLPEIFTTKYFPQYKDDSSFGFAETIPGPSTDEILKIIKDKPTTVIASIYEIDKDNNSYYCSAAILNGKKGYIGKYRKLHIPSAQGIHEVYFFKPGNLGHMVFEVSGIKIAVMLCYDRHFSESARIYGLKDVDILFVCSATPESARHIWQSELCTHAYMNGYYVACANKSGREDKIKFLGTSLICDFKGELINKAKEDEDIILTAEIDIDKARNHRKALSFYRDRRPGLYGDIIKQNT